MTGLLIKVPLLSSNHRTGKNKVSPRPQAFKSTFHPEHSFLWRETQNSQCTEQDISLIKVTCSCTLNALQHKEQSWSVHRAGYLSDQSNMLPHTECSTACWAHITRAVYTELSIVAVPIHFEWRLYKRMVRLKCMINPLFLVCVRFSGNFACLAHHFIHTTAFLLPWWGSPQTQLSINTCLARMESFVDIQGIFNIGLFQWLPESLKKLVASSFGFVYLNASSCLEKMENNMISGVFCTNNAQAPSLFSNVTLTSRRSYVETVSGNSALLQSIYHLTEEGHCCLKLFQHTIVCLLVLRWKRGREFVHCLYKKLQTCLPTSRRPAKPYLNNMIFRKYCNCQSTTMKVMVELCEDLIQFEDVKNFIQQSWDRGAVSIFQLRGQCLRGFTA